MVVERLNELALPRETVIPAITQIVIKCLPSIPREAIDIVAAHFGRLAAMYRRGSHFLIQPVSPARMREASSHRLTQHGAPQCGKTGLLTLAGVAEQAFQRKEEIEKPDQRLRGEPCSFHPAYCQVSFSLNLVARDERQRRDNAHGLIMPHETSPPDPLLRRT